MSKTHPAQSTEDAAEKIAKSNAAWRAELTPEQCINGVALKFKPDDG